MNDVLVRVAGVCGRLTLNRPAAMNALTLDMAATMLDTLTAWAHDPAIRFVLVDGAGERGLCAGGDIRAFHSAASSNQPDSAIEFFRTEYRLNFCIARFPKPYIVLMDGVVMGGGIGIASHGSHRIVTERSRLAMPEAAIGFFPDVGGTHLLGSPANELGTYLALTASSIGAADAIAAGLADMMSTAGHLPAITRAIEQCEDIAAVERLLESRAIQPDPGLFVQQQAWIDLCFGGETVEEILGALGTHHDPAAAIALQAIHRNSPTSLRVTLEALRRARVYQDLAACLQQEFRLACGFLREHDLVEGIRAAVIDKDRNPAWLPVSLQDVSREHVLQLLSTSSGGQLNLS